VPEVETTFTGWFRENAVNLIVTMFLIGGAWGALEIRNSWRDATVATQRAELDKVTNRIDANEKATAQITFQQTSDHAVVVGLTSDSKQLQINGARIEAQIDLVNNKLDNLVVQLTKLSNKLDTIPQGK